MLVEPASDVGPEMRWPLNRAVLNLPLAPIAPQGEWHTFSPFQSHLDELQRSLRNPTLPSMLDYPLVTSSLGRRDPNSFYYRKRPAHPVTEYSLNCAQYRHAGSEEVFICTCTLVGTGKKLDGSRALLECTVEASNLTDPVKLSISVKLTVKESSTYDLILGLLL